MTHDAETITLVARFGADADAMVAAACAQGRDPDALAVVVLLPELDDFEGRVAQLTRSSNGELRRLAHGAIFPCDREHALAAVLSLEEDPDRDRFAAHFAATQRGEVVLVFVGACVRLARHRCALAN